MHNIVYEASPQCRTRRRGAREYTTLYTNAGSFTHIERNTVDTTSRERKRPDERRRR